jgi:hypothetical protein
MLTATDGILLLLVSITIIHYIHCQAKCNRILKILQNEFINQADRDIQRGESNASSSSHRVC